MNLTIDLSHIIRIIIVIIIFIIVPHQLIAKKYYLDPKNGCVNNNGSIEKPWSSLANTIKSNWKSIEGGDTLILYSGYHGKDLYITGFYNLPVTIKAAEGHHPQLLNTLIFTSNWILDGLTFSPEGTNEIGYHSDFDNGTLLYLTQNSQNVIVKNCYFYSINDASMWKVLDWRKNVWSGVVDAGISNKIVNCKFFNIAFAIQILEGSKNSLIESCHIENFSGDGIRIAGADYAIVKKNIIKNSIELDSNTTVGNHEDGIQGWGEIVGLIISGNYILNESRNRPLAGFMQGIVIFDGSVTNSIFENNIIVTEHWHGITLYGAYNCKIINNTCVPYPYSKPFIIGPPWIQIAAKKDGTPSSGNIVRNNLSTSFLIDPSSTKHDHNIWDSDIGDFFKNFFQLDLHPKPNFIKNGLTIIDSGSSEDAPLYDFDGNKRPHGNGFDIGAYEYVELTYTQLNASFNELPSEIILLQNYPNPFNPQTTISYIIAPTIGHTAKDENNNLQYSLNDNNIFVTLKIYDVIGNEIVTLVNEYQKPGKYNYQVLFTQLFSQNNFTKEITSGVYFYQLKANNFTQTKKMIFLK